uniref:Conserved plasma membrane protein n=1 Tax=Elaeophora elaphi TaxID=1147741 RepID=A0A0R3S7F1_9BILA
LQSGDWRQSLAALLCILLCFVVLLSVCCTGIYLIKDKPVYEELVDYLDKSIAISKINYNQQLGFFELAENELQILEQHRMYKTLLWSFLFADLGCYFFLTICILIYLTMDTNKGKAHVIFWLFFVLAILYCVTEVHVLAFMIFPYASLLPTVTENLLNHAIPYNPGGLVQMEQRLGCIFDLNLYAAQKRKQNPSNTCDPYISSAFVGKSTLWTLLALRLMPVVFFVVLISRKVALSEALASLAQRFRAAIRSSDPRSKKANYQQSFTNGKRTVMGVPSTTTTAATSRPNVAPPQPALSLPTENDHSTSYNNAAFFATSGAPGLAGLNSSRSSEISRSDAIDLYRPPVQTSSSIMSEV